MDTQRWEVLLLSINEKIFEASQRIGGRLTIFDDVIFFNQIPKSFKGANFYQFTIYHAGKIKYARIQEKIYPDTLDFEYDTICKKLP